MLDTNEILILVRQAEIGYLLLSLFVVTISRIVMAIKWQVLLRAVDISIGFCDIVKTYYVSTFLGVFLPPTIGADAVRAYSVSKKGYNLHKIISSIVIERFIGMIVLLMFCMISGLILIKEVFYGQINSYYYNFISIILFTTASVFFLITFNTNINSKIHKILNNNDNSEKYLNIKKSIMSLQESYVSYKESKCALINFAALTILENIVKIYSVYFVILAFNLDVKFIYILSIVPIITVFTRLPLSIDGIGIHEGGYAFFLSLIGYSMSYGFSIGAVNHLVSLIAIAPGAIFYSTEKVDNDM